MASNGIVGPADAEGFGGGIWKMDMWQSLRKLRYGGREYLAEFIGTFVLYFGGSGVNIVAAGMTKDWLLISIGWGLAVMMGVYTAAGVSGAHLNPAVTLGMAVFNGFSWIKVPGFVIAQILGAYFAALLNIGLNKPIIKSMSGTDRFVADPRNILDIGADTSGNFCTWPGIEISNSLAFATEVVLTAFLLFGIFAITNTRNPAGNPPGMNGFLVGMLVVVIGACWGVNTGYAINPARDFGPRLAMVTVGYNKEVFTACDHYFWIPIIAPLVGSVVGGVFYFGLIDHTDITCDTLCNKAIEVYVSRSESDSESDKQV